MTNTTCVMCGAFEEWDVHPSYHPERGKAYRRRWRDCRCAALDSGTADARYMTNKCLDCGEVCHANAKRCTSCNVAHDLRRIDAPYPKCRTCQKQLAHHLAQRCDDCKRDHNRIMSYRRSARQREAKRSEAA